MYVQCSDLTHSCRDITLVDESRKSVIVTLWRKQAEEIGAQLEALQNPIVVMTKMRVGDYNGVSVSGTYGSHFLVDPTGYPEAVALQQWWDSEGSNQTFSPAGVPLNCTCIHASHPDRTLSLVEYTMTEFEMCGLNSTGVQVTLLPERD